MVNQSRANSCSCLCGAQATAQRKSNISIIQPGSAGQLSGGQLAELTQIPLLCLQQCKSCRAVQCVLAPSRQILQLDIFAAGSAGTYRERRSSGSRHSAATAAAASLLSWTHHTAGPWGG